MHTPTYKLFGFVVFFGATVGAARLQAQNTFALPFSLTQSSPATAFKIDSFGTFSEAGPLSSSATFSFTGNPQMVWMPALGAFRAGAFSGTQSTVGQYSVAFGQSSVASGYSSVAMGGATASGSSAIALSGGSASGSNAVSMSGGNASGSGSVALVGGAMATGQVSFAVGFGSTASGMASAALGQFTLASNNMSTALGYYTIASGEYSTSTGSYTTANSLGSFAIGQYNVGLSSTGATPNATSWVATDPLLELGNGTSSSAKSDAVVVYKNGNMTVKGVVTVAAGGDIPMYTGNPN